LNGLSSGLLNRGVWVRVPPGALITLAAVLAPRGASTPANSDFRVAQPVERPAVNRMVVGSIPTPGAYVPLTERPRFRSSKPARWVRLPQGTLGDRLMVGCLPLKQAMKVRTLLRELL